MINDRLQKSRRRRQEQKKMHNYWYNRHLIVELIDQISPQYKKLFSKVFPDIRNLEAAVTNILADFIVRHDKYKSVYNMVNVKCDISKNLDATFKIEAIRLSEATYNPINQYHVEIK